MKCRFLTLGLVLFAAGSPVSWAEEPLVAEEKPAEAPVESAATSTESASEPASPANEPASAPAKPVVAAIKPASSQGKSAGKQAESNPKPSKADNAPHRNVGLGIGGGITGGHDSKRGSYSLPVLSVDITGYNTYFGNYGLTRLQADVGDLSEKIPYVAVSSSGMGGWQLIGLRGAAQARGFHLGLEPLNVAVRGSTRRVIEEGNRQYRLLNDETGDQAESIGLSEEQVRKGQNAILSELKKRGIPLDDNDSVPHTVNYIEAVPAISAGFEKQICGTGNILVLARGGAAFGTVGKEKYFWNNFKHPVPAYGVGAYGKCKRFNFAAEATHYAARERSLDTAEITGAVQFSKYGSVALDARAVHESNRSKVLPTSAGDNVTDFQVTAAVRVAAERN